MTTVDFADWYQESSHRLHATLVAAVGDVDVARDAVDEACARAFARWDRVGTYDNPAGWVYVVALREARRLQRRRGRRFTVIGVPGGDAGGAPAAEIDLALWDAVRRLPERMRTAVALRYVADLTEAEVAEAMTISRGGASSLLHKARVQLRDLLGEEVVTDDVR